MPGYELIGEEERRAVLELFEDGGVLFRHGFEDRRRGRFRVREFERALAERLGVADALAVSSGTAALKVALVALGVGPGDEVITQAFTFVATVEAILDVGARPVIVNVDETLNMDPAELAVRIGERTRAVIPVHMLGVAARMEEIRAVASRHDIPVLEDACQALGCSLHGRMVGTLGQIGAFSLDFGKVITTGEGGIVVTDDDELHARASEYHDHGHQNWPDVPRGQDTRRMGGFNYRMTEVQAAIGLAQLPKLDPILAANRRNHAILEASLEGEGWLIPRTLPDGCQALCDSFVFLLSTEADARRFGAEMQRRRLATKNLPDAIDWHFAGRWDHLNSSLGFSALELREQTEPSRRLLARAIAVPIMVRHTPEKVEAIGAQLREIAREVL